MVVKYTPKFKSKDSTLLTKSNHKSRSAMNLTTLLALYKPENSFWFCMRPRLTCDECAAVIAPASQVYQTHHGDADADINANKENTHADENAKEDRDVCQVCVRKDSSLIVRYSLRLVDSEEALKKRIKQKEAQ